jgi:LytR cell envelope-related transcriptional attenuator
VEYSLPRLEPVAQRWRTATLVAAGVAAVELVVIIVITLALVGRGASAHTRHTPSAALPAAERSRLTTAPAGATKLPRAKTYVVVLNGNGRTGAAGMMASLVRARGYKIATVGNAPRNDYARSMVMYRPSFRAEAARLARDMHIRVVGPLDGLARGRLGRAQTAIVVGR